MTADGVKWFAGWYATRLHFVGDGTEWRGDSAQAACGAWVYHTPRTEWAEKKILRGLPRCKHCERILSQNAEGHFRPEAQRRDVK